MNIKYIVVALSLIAVTFLHSNIQATALATSQQFGGLSFGPTFGYTFLATQSFKITALGYKSPNNFSTQIVDFWSSSKGTWGTTNSGVNTKLTSLTVVKNGPTSFLSGGYWYTPLATPITIVAGNYYSLSTTVAIATGSQMGVWTPISGIQITQAILGITAGTINANYTTVIGATTIPINLNAWLEPLPTPEPSTYLILGSLMGISSFAIYKRRKLA